MSALIGTGALIRLIVRRDRLRLPVWIALPALITAATAASFTKLYPTLASRHLFANVADNPAFLALVGPIYDPMQIGGLVAWRVSTLLAVLISLMSALLVIRHTRAEEEAGRRELLGAAVVGRHAPLTAALAVAVGANLGIAALVALALIASGLAATGALALGLALGAAGAVFAAIAAVAAQLTVGARAANGIAGALLGLAFLLRAVGDATGASALAWASPIGWAQRVRAFADERWWVFALAAAVVLALAVAAFGLSAERDLGAGVLPARLGPAAAPPRLRSPLALAWRLQRGALVGWSLGFAVLGVVLGSTGPTVDSLVRTSPVLAAMAAKLRGQGTFIDAYFAAMLGLAGIVASAYALQAALRLRGEEEAMRVEPLLATPVGRLRWASSHLIFAAIGPALALALVGAIAGLVRAARTGDVAGEVGRLTAGALVQVPAVWVVAAIAVVLFGWRPRLAALSWGALVAFLLVRELGLLLPVPAWVLDLTPFAYVPRVPGGAITAAPLLGLVAVAALLVAVGLVGLRRRDVG